MSIRNFVPEFWSKKLGVKFYDGCVMSECVNRDYEGEIKQCGDKVNIITTGDILVNRVTSSPIVYQVPTSDKQQLVIDQEEYFAIAIPDVDKVQANVKLMDKYIAEAKKAAAKSQDTFLLSKRADVNAKNILTSLTPTTDNIYDTFVDLHQALEDSNAIDSKGMAANGKRPWVIINPLIKKYIILSKEFRARSTSATDEIIRKGGIFEYAGFDVLSATNLKKIDNSVEILAGTNSAITFASQIVEVEPLRDQEHFRDLVRGHYLYGGRTVKDDALAKVKFTFGS